MEYKFRGKNYNGEWIFGGVMPASNGKHNAIAIWGQNGITAIAVDFKTVGLFTGLKDKNDKEIYEGDIIKYGKETFEIIYSEGISSFTVNFNKKNIKCYPNMNIGTMKYAEVTGNIYENPELLEVKDERN